MTLGDLGYEDRVRDREALRTAYRRLVEPVSEILSRHDPIGIHFEDNTDEYEPEVDARASEIWDLRALFPKPLPTTS